MSRSNEEPRSRRLDAYIRVSQVGKRDRESGSYITEAQQEERIRAWALANGHTISDDGPDEGVWREIDVSGGKMDRPKLNAIMARIDADESGGVVVYRLDRFARTLVGSLELIQRIDKRGALFASVSDSFDITTANGRMVLRMMLNLAQWELERIAENWRDARERRMREGWHLGPVPYGYTRAEEWDEKAKRIKPVGPLLPDPIEAPIVRDVFARRAGGESWASIRDRLNEAGTWTKAGVPWTHSALTRMIGRTTYLGFAGGGGKSDPPRPDCHKPLVDEEVWQAAQQRRMMRASSDGGALVRGLVRCASCRYALTLRNQNDAGLGVYYCSRQVHGGDCPDPVSIVARPANGRFGLDEYVTEVMFNALERVEFEALDVDLADLRTQLDVAIARRDENADDTEAETVMGRPAYLRRSAALAADAENKQEIYNEALRAAGVLGGTPVAELKRMWPELPLDVKRNHLARAVRYVFVRPAPADAEKVHKASDEASRRSSFAARVHVVLTGDAEVEVPRQGVAGFVIRPFPS